MRYDSDGQDRRKDPRLENNIPLKLSQDGLKLTTNTINISRSGAYCTVEKYIEPMTKMKINLQLPVRENGKFVTKKISCEGVVVRAEECEGGHLHNVAIFFNDISETDAKYIAGYVNSYLDN